ncbi:MAG: Alpha/beta hydrolase family protein [Gemmataceae bacterium]|nr:Alpha/beta hydrolase family protein [Gemmataceae bacterium]
MTTPPTFGRRARRFVARWAVLLFVVYLGAIVVFLSLENSLVFQPSSPAESWLAPANPRTQDVWFTDAAGTKVHGWWLPPARAEAGAVLVAHGNGGNVTHRGRLAADLHDALGAGVLLFDYPGYGKSEGRPSEQGCYAAGDAALKWLKDEAKIPPGRVVLFGESLGGGTAVDLATRHDHRAIVLVFTFTSLPAAAKFHYPWLPTHTLMRNRFDNLSKIGDCTRPVFIAHGTADEIVPFRHGEQLFAAANEPKEFLRLEGFTHNVLFGDLVCGPLGRFLERYAP